MPFDSLIANPGRLRILTALATKPQQEFVHLRGVTRMTDGNLTSHARRLCSAGMLAIDKTFRDGKPVTTFTLTQQGRGALETHVETLVRAIRPQQDQPIAAEAAISASEEKFSEESDWVD